MKTGDLIFTQIGSDGNSISAVTQGYNGASPDHVGMIIESKIGLFVLEAFPPEVRLTQIEVFLRRSEYTHDTAKYMVGRLKKEFSHLIPKAIEHGLKQRDVPYDVLYLTDVKKLYCSELIVDMFKFANGNIDFFAEHPMSFRDLQTGLILKHWIEYYSYFGMQVPDGKRGSNPGDLSLDEKIDIIEFQWSNIHAGG